MVQPPRSSSADKETAGGSSRRSSSASPTRRAPGHRRCRICSASTAAHQDTPGTIGLNWWCLKPDYLERSTRRRWWWPGGVCALSTVWPVREKTTPLKAMCSGASGLRPVPLANQSAGGPRRETGDQRRPGYQVEKTAW